MRILRKASASGEGTPEEWCNDEVMNEVLGTSRQIYFVELIFIF
jgi:hypothetical protein